MRKLLSATLAFAVMFAPLAPVMAAGAGSSGSSSMGGGSSMGSGGSSMGSGSSSTGGGSSSMGSGSSMGAGGQTGNRVREHRSVETDRDHGRTNCRTIITRMHRNGATVTRRERKCD
jgi:hypothetical protein